FGFVKKCADPPVIAFHSAQCPQMLQGTADHARYGGNRFEDDRTMTITPGKKRVREETQELHEGKSRPIAKILRRMVLPGWRRNRHVDTPVGDSAPAIIQTHNERGNG
ncbi:MAG: hypothetical protein WCE67_06465, partial [Azonexus sp.]